MNKRAVAAAVISLALALPAAGQAFAVSPVLQDIDHSAAKQQIQSLQERGIIQGAGGGQFNPQASLTVAEGVSLIVKAMQLSLAAIDFNQAPVASAYFSKVQDQAWYADAMVIAHFNGIELPADVDPQAPLTREAFTNYLVKGLEKTGSYPLIKMYIHISDEKELDAAYQETIQRALLYKVAELDDKGNFNPKQLVNREEGAVLLFKAVSFVDEHREQSFWPAKGLETEGAVEETPAVSP
jgi:hypothetical protein